MIDPISALGIATAAFNTVKKGFEVGKDLESMYGDVGRWMGAVSDINEAERQSKNPPIFKKIFVGASVEEEALNAFAAKKKAQAMETELRNFINLTHGPNAWNELLQMQGKIRKQRQEMIYKQQEKKRKIMEYSFIAVFGLVSVYLFYLFVAYLLTIKTAKSHDCLNFHPEAMVKYYFICVNEGPGIAQAEKEKDEKHLDNTTITVED
tara:strand:- start:440 stop:1063 length:624 start_codon:yes stop_codon:yes gene_type:complete